jgi:ABC-2 type transport system ATP-binding protein
MINFKNFSFYYTRNKPIYTDLNLCLEPGTIYGLLGRNGAGKSTLLNNICGLSSPKNGSVTVYDKTPSERSPYFLNDIYIIPDEVYIPAIQLKKFIQIYAPFYPNFSLSDFEKYLDLLNVPESKNLKELSFGQQKKFIVAFALACNTSTLIMDEPTNGLDIPSKGLFRKLIASLNSKDKTLIISTHQVRDLDDLIHHILIVKNGQFVLNNTIREISKRIIFKFYQEKPAHKNVLEIETVPGGFLVMHENEQEPETKVNIEQLFNACITRPTDIERILNTQ